MKFLGLKKADFTYSIYFHIFTRSSLIDLTVCGRLLRQVLHQRMHLYDVGKTKTISMLDTYAHLQYVMLRNKFGGFFLKIKSWIS